MKKRQLNTLIISWNFLPVEGGIQTYMYQLAKNWNFGDVAVLCSLKKDEPPFQEQPFHIERYKQQKAKYWSSLKRITFYLFSGRPKILTYKYFFYLLINRNVVYKLFPRLDKMVDFFNRKNEDFVIQASKANPEAAIALFAKIIYGYPLVIYIHGRELSIDHSKITTRFMFHFLLKNADLVIANSHYTKNLAKKYGVFENNIEVVLLGADQNKFYPKATPKDILDKFNFPENTKLLLTISHLVKRKGNDTIIKALPIVLKNNQDVHYLIVGKGEYEQKLRSLSKNLNVDKHVHFAGFVPDDKLNDYMNACDIFVLPNRKDNEDIEGFGIVFLEANACKKAAIGGRSGGAVDAIVDGKSGLLVDPYSPADVAEKINYLLANPEKAEAMGEWGYKRVQNELNWNCVTKLINRLIKKRLLA